MQAHRFSASLLVLVLLVVSARVALAQDLPAPPTSAEPLVQNAPPVVAPAARDSAVAAAPVMPVAPAVPAAPVVPAAPAAPASTAAAEARPVDRVTFGDDVVVRHGERVRDVVTMGGDARIEGEVLGSVVTMGGDATVLGHVVGDVVTMGGDAEVASDAVVDGEVTTMGGSLDARSGATTGPVVTLGGTDVAGLAAIGTLGGLAAFVHSALAGAASFGLLFLLGLLMLGAARERFEATHVVIAREPFHVLLLGVASFAGAVVAIVLLAITVLGIPAAIVLALTLSLGCYVGLASVAAVIGAVLPIAQRRERPVMQLAAGIATLYLASLVPGVGTFALTAAGAIGLGAVVRTRLGKIAPPSVRASQPGPYPTSSYPQGA